MIMRLVDLMLVFPRFFLLLAVLAFLRPSIWTIMAVIGLTGWMSVARLVRAEFLTLKEREFVLWSQSIGASAFRIIWRHILPNAMAPVLVAMTLGIPAAILTESGLSFLGLGVQPPYATWGNILNEGKDAIEIGWWLSFYPGLAILSPCSPTTSSARAFATRSIRGCARRRPRCRRRASDILRLVTSCRSGGTGRRARLRGVWGNPWGFESPLRQAVVAVGAAGRRRCRGRLDRRRRHDRRTDRRPRRTRAIHRRRRAGSAA